MQKSLQYQLVDGTTVTGRPLQVRNEMVTVVIDGTLETTKRTMRVWDICPVAPIKK